jgi:Flp pilus assembly protein TadG
LAAAYKEEMGREMTRKEKANLRRTHPQRVAGRKRAEKGQSLVEAAIIVPILILLLAVVVDAARAFDAYIVLTNAVREGARFATIEPSPDENMIRQLVVADVVDSGTNVTNMRDFSASDVEVILSNPTVVTVTAQYEFDLWFGGIVGLPTFHLEKEAAMPMYLWETAE